MINTVNILFDGKGLQAQFQAQYGTRLAALFSTFDQNEFSYQISDINDPITSESLAPYNILAITSRYKKGGTSANPDPAFYYTDDELTAITDFVKSGNGLLLMSNHSTGAGNDNNITMYDVTLAQQFGVTLEQAFLYQPGTNTSMSGDLLSADSPIITGGSGVSQIVINDCCALSCTDGTVIAQINPNMTDGHTPPIDPSDQAFAISLAGNDFVGSGRAVFTADSGFIGECDDPNPAPGPGQYCENDNPSFMVNVINWLAGNL